MSGSAGEAIPGTAALELRDVSRWYGQVLGVSGLSLSLGPGVHGLLGPNGAGKSTLLRLAAGQLRPHRGRVLAFGREAWNDPRLFRRLGYCPEEDAFYSEMTGRGYLTWMLRLSGYSPAQAGGLAADALERAGLGGAGERRINGYSKGMRQRLKMALAAATDPDLLLLDEPLSGMDPLGRRAVIGWLRRVDGEGRRTVLVSSHVLHEVQSMTRSVVLLHRGRVLAEGDVREIRALLDRHPHRVRLEVARPRRAAALLLGFEDVVCARVEAGEDGRGLVDAETVAPDLFYGRLPGLVDSGELEVTGLDSPDDNLQAVFDYLVK